jgi:threonine/homoserine/homoserine lactone efflux protein
VHLVFLLALLPQFVDFAAASASDLALVTLAILVITTIPMLAVSALGARIGRLGFGWARRVTRVSGVALAGARGGLGRLADVRRAEMDPVVILGLFVAAAASSAAAGAVHPPGLLSVRDGRAGERVAGHGSASPHRRSCFWPGSWGVISCMVRFDESAQTAVRLGGIVLLIGLALTMLAAPRAAGRAHSLVRWRLSDGAMGLVAGLSSPMNLVFILALLPQFVDLSTY